MYALLHGVCGKVNFNRTIFNYFSQLRTYVVGIALGIQPLCWLCYKRYIVSSYQFQWEVYLLSLFSRVVCVVYKSTFSTVRLRYERNQAWWKDHVLKPPEQNFQLLKFIFEFLANFWYFFINCMPDKYSKIEIFYKI